MTDDELMAEVEELLRADPCDRGENEANAFGTPEGQALWDLEHSGAIPINVRNEEAK